MEAMLSPSLDPERTTAVGLVLPVVYIVLQVVFLFINVWHKNLPTSL